MTVPKPTQSLRKKHLNAQEIVNEKFGGIKISDDVLDKVAEELAER